MHAYRDQYAQTFNAGRNVVLLAISTDPVDALESWARDDEFPFLMGSDVEGAVGRTYGVLVERGDVRMDRRVVFVIGPDGVVKNVFAPFREIDPTAYDELGEAVRATLPVDAEESSG